MPMDVDSIQAYGIWRLDVTTGAIDLVFPFSDLMLGMVSISPDGKWMVFEYCNKDGGVVLDLQSGEAYSFSLPFGAWVAGWQ